MLKRNLFSLFLDEREKKKVGARKLFFSSEKFVNERYAVVDVDEVS